MQQTPCEEAKELEDTARGILNAAATIYCAACRTVGEICANVVPAIQRVAARNPDEPGESANVENYRQAMCGELEVVAVQAVEALHKIDPKRAKRVLKNMKVKGDSQVSP